MAHLAEGVLRAYLDEELPPARRADVDRHLADCAACRRALAEARADLQWTADRLGALQAGSLPVAAGPAWRRLSALQRGQPLAAVPARRPVASRRLPASRLVAGVAAALVVAAFSLPSVRAAAGGFLSLFRVERLQVVAVSPQDLTAIHQALRSGSVNIRGLADISISPPQNKTASTTLAGARNLADFPVLAPETPVGYRLSQVTFTPWRRVDFRLHAGAINRLLASLGSTARIPAAADGKQVQVRIGEAVQMHYQGSGAPIRVTQSVTPEVGVPAGVDVAALRQALLQLPFLPADLRNQLAAVSDWRRTALIPEVGGTSRNVAVNGDSGVFLQASAPGAQNALAWVSGDQVVRIITGPLDLSQAQALAASMR